jgi:hypothetical protein
VRVAGWASRRDGGYVARVHSDGPIDITDLILTEHESFRRAFAALDKVLAPESDPATHQRRLADLWAPLAAHLERHAAAEELVLFPTLLRHGTNAEHETLDAVGDHNEIRDAVREAAAHPAGSPEWWKAVERVRSENTHHMGEEEDEALSDLRRTTTAEQRVALGRLFLIALDQYRGRPPVPNTDPRAYVARHTAQSGHDPLPGRRDGAADDRPAQRLR